MKSIEFIVENKGLPFPGTYEDEYNMFKRKGARRITALTNEQDLYEVSDSPYEYVQNVRTPVKSAYRFQTDGGNLYRVLVLLGKSEAEPNNPEKRGMEIHFDLTDMQSGKPKTGIEGTGDAIRVFSTVAAIMREEVAKHKPDTVTIPAKASEESRVSLYRKLARRSTRMLTNYNIIGEKSVVGADGNSYVKFILGRKS